MKETVRLFPDQGGAHSQTLGAEAIHLEICRMRLWSPAGNSTNSQLDTIEITALNTTRTQLNAGDLIRCLKICNHLINIDGCSPFAEASVRAMAGSATNRPHADRLTDTQRALRILGDLKQEATKAGLTLEWIIS